MVLCSPYPCSIGSAAWGRFHCASGRESSLPFLKMPRETSQINFRCWPQRRNLVQLKSGYRLKIPRRGLQDQHQYLLRRFQTPLIVLGGPSGFAKESGTCNDDA